MDIRSATCDNAQDSLKFGPHITYIASKPNAHNDIVGFWTLWAFGFEATVWAFGFEAL